MEHTDDGTTATVLVAEALREHRHDFESFVRSRVSSQDVDDVLQLAAARAVEKAHSLEDHGAVVGWLYQIHRNLITDLHRKHASERRHVDAAADVPEVTEPVLDESCACSISQAKRLRPSYSSILTMVDTEGLQLAEAAKRLQVSKNNATVRLHRARQALKDAMLEHCGVADPRDCASCRCIEDACCLV